MRAVGSCNGKTWAVNDGAAAIQYSGPSLIEDGNIEVCYLEQHHLGHQYIRNARGKYGLAWSWEFDAVAIRPMVWVITDSAGVPQIVWESEQVVNLGDPDEVPVQVQFRGRDLVDEYVSIEMAWPNEDLIDSIRDLVVAAVFPEWISGQARYGDVDTTTKLLKLLFVEKQVKRGLRNFATIAEVYTRNMHSFETRRYTLLWLRSASQILENHGGETCIPLICNRTTVDSSSGQITLV